MEKLADRTTWKTLSLTEIERNLKIAEQEFDKAEGDFIISDEDKIRAQAVRDELWLRREIAKTKPASETADAVTSVETKTPEQLPAREIILGKRLVSDGDYVTEGQAIAEGETDKASSEILAEASGIIHFTVEEGGTFKDGEPIATIEPASIRIISRESDGRNTTVEETYNVEGHGEQKFAIRNLEELKKMFVPVDGKQLFRGLHGRWFANVKIGNTTLPMYVSSEGTSGKKQGKWYPFFANTEYWIVKGGVEEMNDGYGIKEIQDAQKFLNENLELPQNTFGLDGTVKVSGGKVVEDINKYFSYGSFALGEKWAEGDEINKKLGLPDIQVSETEIKKIEEKYALGSDKFDSALRRLQFEKAFKIWKEKFDANPEQPIVVAAPLTEKKQTVSNSHAELIKELQKAESLNYDLYQKLLAESPDDVDDRILKVLGKRIGDKIAYTYLGRERKGEIVIEDSEVRIREEGDGSLTYLTNILVTKGSITMHPKSEGKKWPPDAIFDSPIEEKPAANETMISQQELRAKLESILVSGNGTEIYGIELKAFSSTGSYFVRFSQKSKSGTIMHFAGNIRTPKSAGEKFQAYFGPDNIRIETKGKIDSLMTTIRNNLTDDKVNLAVAVTRKINEGLNQK